MTFAQLEIFVTVVECQSFSLAASHLGISQSGVSHEVANLEAELRSNANSTAPSGDCAD